MLGNYTRSVTLTVAASNSSADSQAEADYLCTGTNDQTQIQAALNALPTNGGRVVLLERTYNISATIRIEKGSTALEGQATGQRARVTQAGIGTKLLAASGLTVRIGTAVDGVLYFSNGGKVNQVHVHNMSGSGIRVLDYATCRTLRDSSHPRPLLQQRRRERVVRHRRRGHAPDLQHHFQQQRQCPHQGGIDPDHGESFL